MNLQFNGQACQTTATTLAELLREQGYEPTSKVATAVNGQFVAKHSRDAYTLSEGDQIEVVAPMQGG